MTNEKAVEVGQLSQVVQPHSPQTNVGYFEPYQLVDLAQKGRLYLIADPIGSAASGQVAGQYAIRKIIHNFYTGEIFDPKERLLTAIRQANTEIFEENNRHPERRPMATTLTAAWIQGNKLLVANVGDNRAYVVWDQDIERLQEISPPVSKTNGTDKMKPVIISPSEKSPEEKNGADKAEVVTPSSSEKPPEEKNEADKVEAAATPSPSEKPPEEKNEADKAATTLPSEKPSEEKDGADKAEVVTTPSSEKPRESEEENETTERPEATVVSARLSDTRPMPLEQTAVQVAKQQTKEMTPILPRERLLQGLGLDKAVKIELFSRRLFPGDIVVLCSGNLVGYVDEKEIAKTAHLYPPKEALKQLISLAGERGNRDTLALSIMRVSADVVTTQPPTPMPLPPPPDWDDWKIASAPLAANKPFSKPNPLDASPKAGPNPLTNPKTGPNPLMPVKPAEPVNKKPDFSQSFPPPLRMDADSPWPWQRYKFVAVLAILLLCAAPILAWRYLLPTDMIASMLFLGDDGAASLNENESSGSISATENETGAETLQQSAGISLTATPASSSSPTLADALAAESRGSSASTPETSFVSPVGNPTPTPGPDDAQTAADSIVLVTSPTPTPLPLPTITLPAGCENGARFYRDITVPDGTQFSPGESFEKVWLLTNARSCPWGPGYTVRFISGDRLGAGEQIPLQEVVQPETNGEISVPMTAPDRAGQYRSEWQLYDLNGQPFGPEIYVEIEVVSSGVVTAGEQPQPSVGEQPQPSPSGDQTTLYDFIQNAGQATWSSGDVTYPVRAGQVSENLELPAPQGLVVSGIGELRGNTLSESNILLTYPHQELGFIEGAYQIDTPLQPTDILTARLGFTKLSILSDDGVTFEVIFTPDGGSENQVIFSRTIQYPESPIEATYPLSGIEPGQTGTFTLRAVGGESLSQDWAIWMDLRLIRP